MNVAGENDKKTAVNRKCVGVGGRRGISVHLCVWPCLPHRHCAVWYERRSWGRARSNVRQGTTVAHTRSTHSQREKATQRERGEKSDAAERVYKGRRCAKGKANVQMTFPPQQSCRLVCAPTGYACAQGTDERRGCTSSRRVPHTIVLDHHSQNAPLSPSFLAAPFFLFSCATPSVLLSMKNKPRADSCGSSGSREDTRTD